MIHTIQEAEKALQPYVPLVSQLLGKGTTMERTVPLMKLAGNPQERLRIVHVAGTSGKTSTAYYIAALLQASGQRVGLTVSPHIDSVTERIQLNGQPMSEKEFCQELDRFLKIVRQAEQIPTYFEVLYCFALWTFERQGVDYAVVETGMGGLYDATNIAARADKVCVITDIGFDHMHILGDTLAAIAGQKIGIAHRGNAVLMYEQSDEVMDVVRAWVEEQGASLQPTTETAERASSPVRLDALALYQQRNWLLAYYVYKFVSNRDGLQHLTSKVLSKSLQVKIPARMDVRQAGGKTIVMDGAHNEQKMATFIASFQAKFPGMKPAVMLALKEGKEYEKVLPLIAPFASRLILTTFETSAALPARATEPAVMAGPLRTYPALPVICVVDQLDAFRTLMDGPEKVGVITGSFYLIAQLRAKERIIA